MILTEGFQFTTQVQTHKTNTLNETVTAQACGHSQTVINLLLGYKWPACSGINLHEAWHWANLFPSLTFTTLLMNKGDTLPGVRGRDRRGGARLLHPSPLALYWQSNWIAETVSSVPAEQVGRSCWQALVDWPKCEAAANRAVRCLWSHRQPPCCCQVTVLCLSDSPGSDWS